MKKLKSAGLLFLIIFGIFAPVTVFAGGWKNAAKPDGQRWRYENSDGTYAEGGWFWLDGNRDGVSECYYFDEGGWMLSGALTPDGYTVNQDGAWTVQTVVQTRATGNLDHVSEEREAMIPITIQIGEKTFNASLMNNGTTQALLTQLPMTVTMNEMNGNEKYDYLPNALPTASRSIGNIHSGDIMLYGSDCLVLFYEDFRTSYRYTQLGAISDTVGLSEALGSGSVQVTFRLNLN